MDNTHPKFRPSRTLAHLYPEVGAGGFTRADGFVEFYSRVNALLESGTEVLDFGAGRGLWATENLAPYHRQLRAIEKRAKRVVGVDVDPVVLENPTLAEAKLMEPGGPIPYPDGSFDMVIADHVLEHVGAESAPVVADEIMRVLRPGGWLAARTPNKWGIIGIGARAVPNDLHTRVLRRLQPDRKAEDVFPVRYQMNTRKALRRLFPEPAEVIVFGHSSEPRYFGESPTAWRAAQLADRLTPPRFAPTLMIFVRKAG